MYNYANAGQVNGPKTDTHLNGIVSAERPSQLQVGPKFLPSFLYGPYWVVAAGPGVVYMFDVS